MYGMLFNHEKLYLALKNKLNQFAHWQVAFQKEIHILILENILIKNKFERLYLWSFWKMFSFII